MERTAAVEAADATPARPAATAAWPVWVAYLALVGVAEALGFVSPVWTLALDLALVCLLPIQASLGPGSQPLLLALALAPLVRVVSLALPLNETLALPYWYALTSTALLSAAVLAARALGLSREQLGLTRGRVPLQIAIGLVGLPLGVVAYYVAPPIRWLDETAPTVAFVAMAVLLVLSGGLVEFIFRGVLQASALACLGRGGLVYVSVLFATLYIGQGSTGPVLLALGTGLGFAWLTQRTASLLGVSLAHGLTNVLGYLVLPALLTQPYAPPLDEAPTAPPSPVAPRADTPLPVPTTEPEDAGPEAIVSPALPTLAAAPAVGTALEPPPATAPDPPTAAGAEASEAIETERAPPAAEQPTEPYVVQPGDTLFLIAQDRGTTVSTLVALNAIPDPDSIVSGAVLRVPPRPPAE